MDLPEKTLRRSNRKRPRELLDTPSNPPSDSSQNAKRTASEEDATQECSICSQTFQGFGHNALPINHGRCCDNCNELVFIERYRQSIAEGRQGMDGTKKCYVSVEQVGEGRLKYYAVGLQVNDDRTPTREEFEAAPKIELGILSVGKEAAANRTPKGEEVAANRTPTAEEFEAAAKAKAELLTILESDDNSKCDSENSKSKKDKEKEEEKERVRKANKARDAKTRERKAFYDRAGMLLR